MSQNSQEKNSPKLTSGQQGSPARMLALPVSERVSKAKEQVCFLTLSDWFAQYDLKSSCWRTSQACLVPGMDEYKQSWPKRGIMLFGISYPLPMSAHYISVNAGSASAGGGESRGPLPTPQSRDFRTGEGHRWENSERSRNLNDAVAHQQGYKMWTTPNCQDGREVGGKLRPSRIATGRKTDYLCRQVQIWPTASSRDWKDSPGMSREATNPDGSKRKREDQLARAVYARTWPTPNPSDANAANLPHDIGRNYLRTEAQPDKTLSTPEAHKTHGQLNADWVELLMGFSMGWTDLEATEPSEPPTAQSWQDGSWEHGVPRVAKGQKQRVARLKCRGNAVVPQCAEWIGRQLK